MKSLAAILLLAVAGCVAEPSASPPPECSVPADCDQSAGEVCDEGLCWGDPPASTYAIVIGAPADRSDLVVTELPSVAITPDGWFADLHAAWPISLHGRIEASCNGCRAGAAIAASITVRRPSRIPGAPEYLVSTESSADASSTDSFAIDVPAITASDAPYQVAIEPSDSVPLFDGGPTPAEVVPPLRLTVGADTLGSALDEILSADAIRSVHGRVVDTLGEGVPGMKVSALGRVDPLRPLERVSTITTSDGSGNFTLLLGSDALDVVDVVAAPPPGAIAPTIYAHDRFVGTTDAVELRLPAIPGSAHITVPVVHVDTNGTSSPVVNARVQLRTSVTDPIDPQMEAVFEVDGTTDGAGHFDADVIAGTPSKPLQYVSHIVPPASSIAASQVDVIELGAQGGTVTPVMLDPRATLAGVVMDAGGAPVPSVTVTAGPSLGFFWSLDSVDQAAVASREPPSTLTNPDGTFTLWVDPAVAGIASSWDLTVAPPDFSQYPRWTVPAVDGSLSQDLGDVNLPPHAYLRARVLDPDGQPLEDAEVQVYEIVPDLAACSAQNAPPKCQPPAILRGSGRSDKGGIVRLTLPRP